MATNESTPGPWVIRHSYGRGDEALDIGIVADVLMAGEDVPRPAVIAEAFGRVGQNTYMNAEANAHLIAAAPELYAALRMLHDDVADYQRINQLGGFDNHAMKAARAAIAKAEGR